MDSAATRWSRNGRSDDRPFFTPSPPRPTASHSPAALRVGDFRVCGDLHTIADGSTEVSIHPKAMALLLRLARTAGEVVTKEQLLADVWQGAFVTEDVICNSVWELRKAFGDNARKPRYIQTVHRKGYRLIAPCAPVAPGDPGAEDLGRAARSADGRSAAGSDAVWLPIPAALVELLVTALQSRLAGSEAVRSQAGRG